MTKFHYVYLSYLIIFNFLYYFYSRFLIKQVNIRVGVLGLGLYQGNNYVCTSLPAWLPSLSGNETLHMELHEGSVETWGPYRDCPEGKRHMVSLLQSDGEVFPAASAGKKYKQVVRLKKKKTEKRRKQKMT